VTARQKSILAGCALLALTVLLFQGLLFSGKILARGDTYYYFYPYWDARNAAYRAGELPLWTSQLFMGLPLLANPQLGTFYPPNWLTAPFRAPVAISLSIVAHSLLAAAGTCALYRQLIRRRWLPALAAGMLYAFAGNLNAHVEQINQLQGLAWMPLLFLLWHRALQGRTRAGLWLALVWALQILSGHTQTIFISALGLFCYALVTCTMQANRQQSQRQLLRAGLLLAAAFAGAGLLALPQILPSWEMLQASNRSGGLSWREATAFSLPPRLLPRAILPSYDGQIFSEYSNVLGLSGLGLALLGWLSAAGGRVQRRVWLLLALVGLLLALGRYNPLYWLLAQLPGFNAFRVPARFLSLFSLAAAMLAGMGLDALPRAQRHQWHLPLIAAALAAVVTLALLLPPAPPSLIFGGSAVSARAMGLWLLAGLLLLAGLSRRGRQLPALLLLLCELMLASVHMPYQDLAAPEVYYGQRFTISQLQAYHAQETVPGRTLGVSQLFFDPSELPALRRQFERQSLSARAQFHALDAIKMQETLQPNLALTWGIPSLDGFGGGIAPSRYYTQFSTLLLPEGAPLAPDGRLGETMADPACNGACLPPRRWLDASDTRYLITDKVYDYWHEGVGYDRSLARYWAEIPAPPALPATVDEARILHTAPLPGRKTSQTLPDGLLLSSLPATELAALLSPPPAGIQAITLLPSAHPHLFHNLQPPPFERVLSSEIKLYRLPDSGQRAQLTAATLVVPDSIQGDAAALRHMRAGDATVLHGSAEARHRVPAAGDDLRIVAYSDSRVQLAVRASAPAYVVLRDAWYPGWQATVNGLPAPIFRADLLFRAVPVPAGESTVLFVFNPPSWLAALALSLLCWLLLLALAAMPRIRLRRVQGDK